MSDNLQIGEEETDDLEEDLAQSLLDPAFRASYEDAESRAAIIRTLSERRHSYDLTQQAVAERMGTTQSAVSELEGGGSDPRLSTLQRYARAVGSQLAVTVIPAGLAEAGLRLQHNVAVHLAATVSNAEWLTSLHSHHQEISKFVVAEIAERSYRVRFPLPLGDFYKDVQPAFDSPDEDDRIAV